MATVAGSRGTGRKRMTDETREAHSVVWVPHYLCAMVTDFGLHPQNSERSPKKSFKQKTIVCLLKR